MPLLFIYSLLPKLYKHSPNRTYLKKLQSQQKHTITLIFHKSKFAHTRELFKENSILNIDQLNILNNLLFLRRVKNGNAPMFYAVNS